MKNRNRRSLFAGLARPAAMLLLVGMGLSSCEDELLTGQPSWLGQSIYDELVARGKYTETLKLISDPALADAGYQSMLQKTGSKTLFVADDAAWARFYQKNAWGVKSLSEMTPSQKKVLFKSSMIDNAYLIELLSNTPGNPPAKGDCMRRSSSLTIWDEVPRMMPADMPETMFWEVYRKRGDGILLLRDNTPRPMVHFLPKFMRYNAITPEDYYILTNKKVSNIDQAYINGMKVVEQNITCQNGYIHVLEDVPQPSDNMAGIITDKSQFSIFSRLMNRFCGPQYNRSLSQQYNALYNNGTGKEDSVFVLRYFNSSLNHGLTKLDDEDTGEGVTPLPYDPGWNAYTIDSKDGITMAQDAAAMFVPTDEAMTEYFNGAGKALQDRFKTWDGVPDNVIEPLISNCMQTSFTGTVPSKFNQVTNSQNELIGITTADVDSAFVACNGVVYQTNRVFIAPEYQSVFFPVLVRENDFTVLYTTISSENSTSSEMRKTGHFKSYLNSLGSTYSFIAPSDEAMLYYVDPVSYRKTQQVLYKFMRDEVNPTAVKAEAYAFDIATGEVGELLPRAQQPTTEQVVNRLLDILDSHIVIGSFAEGQTHYTTKGGAPIVVGRNSEGKVTLAGAYQVEKGEVCVADSVYDMTDGGNGTTYVLDNSPLMSTPNSPYKVLETTPEYASFFELLKECSFLASVVENKYYTPDMAFTFFNNFHYTIYVPTNESIDELTASGKLPTWDEYNEIKDDEEMEADKRDSTLQVIRGKIENFVRYHIQDNALYLGGASVEGQYETANLDSTINRFRLLNVSYNTGGEMTVGDASGNVRRVQADQSNKFSRQFLFEKDAKPDKAKLIYSSSYAVIHQIDKPLYYAPDQFADKAANQKIRKP